MTSSLPVVLTEEQFEWECEERNLFYEMDF